MERPERIKALIELLDDPEHQVYEAVQDALVRTGPSVLPELESAWEASSLDLVQRRIEDIVSAIQFNDTAQQLVAWSRVDDSDLLNGLLLVAKLRYPELDFNLIINKVKTICHRIWLDLHNGLTPPETAKAISHFCFEVYGFAIHPQLTAESHFVNQLLHSKRGSPVLLALLYAQIGQQLGLPIYPVSLPRNIVLAYRRYADTSDPSPSATLFYISPANKGMMFGRLEVEQFLRAEGIQPQPEHFIPCTNTVAVQTLLQSLVFHLERLQKPEQAQHYKQLLLAMSPPPDG